MIHLHDAYMNDDQKKPTKPTKDTNGQMNDDVKNQGSQTIVGNDEEDYKTKYLRALADYKNLQRQIDNERKDLFEVAVSGVLAQIVPTLDMMYQAEVWVKDPGLAMVKDQLAKTLEGLGLTEVELKGKEYDPHTAVVIETVDGGKDNIVVEVVAKAYAINGKVIRPGQVKVSKLTKKDESAKA